MRVLFKSFKDIFGDHLLDGRSSDALDFAKDSNKFYTPQPLVVVFPDRIEQVQALVVLAREKNLALVASGGRTGLSGGATANNNEVVVSFQRMNRISEYNSVDQLVECEAGVITHDLQQFANQQGMMYPVDFASSSSSQIGGNINTNAGGIKVIRYGMTRDWVAGLTVVTGRGDILELNNGLTKNATGYDLRHLFVGSEGTLGFVVKAQMRLVEQPVNLQVMLLGANSIADLMKVPGSFRAEISITAFEFFCDKGLQLVLKRQGVSSPIDGRFAYYGLLEFDARHEEDVARALSIFESCMEKGLVQDAVMAQSETQALSMWSLRENMSETLSQFTPYKNDLSVKIIDIPAFINEVDTLVQKYYPAFSVVWFGHIGDGNLHLNILKPITMDTGEFKILCEKVNLEIFALVERYRGSISAEHGVGLQKREFLHFSRSAEEIEIMRGIKSVFDPDGIMNPGKLLPG